MLRKLLILGIFAGTSASIPIVYQSNPHLVDGLLKSAAASKPATPATACTGRSSNRLPGTIYQAFTQRHGFAAR